MIKILIKDQDSSSSNVRPIEDPSSVKGDPTPIIMLINITKKRDYHSSEWNGLPYALINTSKRQTFLSSS